MRGTLIIIIIIIIIIHWPVFPHCATYCIGREIKLLIFSVHFKS